MFSTMKCVSSGEQRHLWLRLVTFTVALVPAITSGFSLRTHNHDAAKELCLGKQDGYHTRADCSNYWLCKGGKVLLQRTCSEGTLFNGLMCVPAALVTNCATAVVDTEERPSAASSIECTGLKDGLHRNYYYGDCSGYVLCENGNAVLKGKCRNNLIFDGNICIDYDQSNESLCNFDNNHTDDDMECSSNLMSAGVYTNSNCQNYYYCNNAIGIRSQIYECPKGFTFNVNVQKCMPGYNCSTSSTVDPDELPELDLCHDKQDGYYQDILASGCRSYVYCNKGKKIIYLCQEGYAYDGTSCQAETLFTCPYWSKDCLGKPNGYHADLNTGCRQYFYCLNENKVTTLTCSKSRIFDGSKCIPRTATTSCVSSLLNYDINKYCNGKSNGKYIMPNTKCQNFIICHSNRQIAHGSCATGFIFVNNECVNQNGTTAVQCDDDDVSYVSAKCKENGIFIDINSKDCTSYVYCMNGEKSVLSCPENTVFNGYLCVDTSSYDCSLSTRNI